MTLNLEQSLLSNPAVIIAIIASGVFFLSALLTGVWKYRCMLASEDHLAPHYVDIAHRASLMYSFAAMLLAVFAALSLWPVAVNVLATLAPLFFFGLAIVLYIQLGLANDTDNQFREPKDPRTMAMLMNILIVAEIGGFLVLFVGTLVRLLGGSD